MMEIADLIHATLENRNDPGKLAAIRKEVIQFTSQFLAVGAAKANTDRA